MIVEVCCDDMPLRCDCHEVWSRELQVVGASVTELCEQASVRLEDAHTRTFVVNYDDISLPISAHALRTCDEGPKQIK